MNSKLNSNLVKKLECVLEMFIKIALHFKKLLGRLCAGTSAFFFAICLLAFPLQADRGLNVGSPIIDTPLSLLLRGQDEIAYELGQRKTIKIQDSNGHVHLPEPIDVYLGPQGYVIIDGHHDVYAARSLGVNSVPVRILKDWSHKTPLEFWMELKLSNLIYTRSSAEELSLNPPTLDGIRYNSDRFLAFLLMMKVKMQNGAEKIEFLPSSIWIKLNNEIPFIEFYIVEVLSQAGIHYQAEWGEVIPQSVIEAARRALTDAVKRDSHPQLSGLRIIDTDNQLRWLTQVDSFSGRYDNLRTLLVPQESFRPLSCDLLLTQ